MTTPTTDPAAPPAHWTPQAIGDLTGRTALLAGGNSGIGLETARVLARRLSGTSVTALAVHPGSAVTNLQRHSEGPLSRLAIALTRRTIMGSPEGAAWPSLYTATSPHLPNGAYYAPAGRDQTSGTPKPAPLPHGADDPTEAAHLWQQSERLTRVTFTI